MEPEAHSSEYVLRAFAPPFLTRAHVAMSSPLVDATERLRAVFQFAETVARYLVALLAPDSVSRNCAPQALLDLAECLDSPSFGHWQSTADALAAALVADDGAALRDVAEILRGRDGKPSEAGRALSALVALRNRFSHQLVGGSMTGLFAEAAPDVRRLVVGLSPLRAHPLLVSRDVAQRVDGRYRGVVIRHGGSDATPIELDVQRFDVPIGVPFVVNAAGDVLVLHPWVTLGADRLPVLLDRRKKGSLHYFGGHAEAGGDGPTRDPLWRRAVSRASASLLIDHGSVAPDVPGIHLERRLGAGSAGAVYLGIRAIDGVRVAVKVLHPTLVAAASARARMRAEFDILSRLNHPNIVRVYFHAEDARAGLYTVMEHVAGADLGCQVPPGGLAPSEAVRLAREVMDALKAAHAVGVVHRDVKPSNVLLDEHGHARLIDFGIGAAKWIDGPTRTFDAVGTLRWAAPEQLDGKDADPRADVFGVGRLLQFLLTGSADPAVIVDGTAAAVVRRATQRDPANRFGTIADMRDALHRGDRCPVGPGDLVGTYVVVSALGRSADGLWMLHAREDTTGALAGLVVGRATDALIVAVKSVPANVQADVGWRGVSRTEDGFLVVAVRGGDGPARLVAHLNALRHTVPPAAVPRRFAMAAAVTTAVVTAGAGAFGLAGLISVAGLAAARAAIPLVRIAAKARRTGSEEPDS